MSATTLPLLLTPTERTALEAIRAGRTPSSAAIDAVLSRGWAKRTKSALVLTEAGEKALADDDTARYRQRAAQRPRRK